MKQLLPILLSALYMVSCIPLRIAPKIDDYKLTQGKRFKKGLPKKNVFVFDDPKNEGAFYDFVNTKFQLNDYYVDVGVPFLVDGKEFFFSYYEVTIPTKFINLLPIVIDGALAQSNMDPMLEEVHSSRKDHWYVAIEVYSNGKKDCLKEDVVSKDGVLAYLRALKEEYLSTHNYNEVLFKD